MTDRKIDGLNLGILGGGQLGKMLIQEAVDYNINCFTLDPDADAPCAKLAHTFTQGSLKEYDSVYNFGKDKDLLTIEIENVNADALSSLEKEGVKVYPQPSIIKLIQNKQLQKQFFADHKIPTSPFVLTKNRQDTLENEAMYRAVHKVA
ncbi:MAG: 5-(carboxyamino)imidazole ribonucleotide synthase, partial [Nitrosopumilus sp.]|nr:5-(carboxyamino)imidazole ribonucleotide synthase [Nitrosopumilus sp.]